ncbi:MAG TPA: phosphoenolpyruvate--protein phosphotransferase [Gemmataceae bacterium]|jgi:phosphotransferase system enzyme I (PtsI)|nr:phosphoenolpyruvate--protein phosphotransferase [Gemmataceae bacterium]
MDVKRGIAVSPGVAVGPALVLDSEWFRLPQRFIDPDHAAREIDRLRSALRLAAAEARDSQDAVSAKLGPQYGAIFGAHAMMLADPALAREVEDLIGSQHFAAEYAVSRVIRRYAKALESIQGGHLATRVADLFDLEKRILRHLLGQRREELAHLSEAVVVLAHDLTPSETAALDPNRVHAFATEAGGRASHTAIVAGVLEIPAVVGLGPFSTDVSGGDLVIVDGNRGLLILNPDEETLKRYELARDEARTRQSKLGELRALPAVTRDGVRVGLHGNIEFPPEAAHCVERGADGVGLYRTEFLYLGRQTDPTEEEHLAAYLTVVRDMAGRPVVIRTLDLGADKFLPRTEAAQDERNPFLGLRSVRLCLRNLTLFKTQMRAILRASAHGDVRIMFPMISTLLELRQCKMILEEVKEDLEEEGLAFNPRLPVGTMIEVPAAAILADQLAREVDFFSIGTNDLVQYTLAADRNNATVSSLYSPGDPAVLRLIDGVVKAAAKQDIAVNVCGEMSGEPLYTMLLLGLGVRLLSVTPHNIPEIKKVIRTVTLERSVAVAQEAMRLETARDVNNYLREQTRRILPEAVN